MRRTCPTPVWARRTWRLAAVIAALALVGVACDAEEATDEAAAPEPEPADDAEADDADDDADDDTDDNGEDGEEAEPEPRDLTLDSVTAASVSTSWTVVMPLHIADEHGWWEEEGLDVEITQVGPAPAHMGALIGRSIDFSINISTDTLIRANAQGEDVVAIAGSSNAPIHGLYARDADSVEDLAGRVIATDAPGGTAELLAIEVLEEHGLSEDDVTLTPISGTQEDRQQAVLTGVADAAIGSLADRPEMEAGGAVVLAEIGDIYPEYQWAVTGAHDALLDEHPETVVAFLKGLIRGFEYVQDPANEDEILEILQANDVVVDEDNWSEILGIQRELMTTDGTLNLEGVDVVAEREIGYERIPADFDVDDVLRLEPLDTALEELGMSGQQN